ncbi:dual specificity protein phosphatase family protein [Aspergillus vadensis CBS 113365]|uniref:Phosphatases II n=1 Tax=Aspergillus vadensis (strain CBS 113365 / IMI 142717 / IBT 24658) TaxID=1448311 RepID=A0A319AV71_ASPVC|nr:phosphatases II [Aspergillus vadensis CBS 113365]PYH64149.1 phosphatases II [Aspergillus vadensis CBS 113365]
MAQSYHPAELPMSQSANAQYTATQEYSSRRFNTQPSVYTWSPLGCGDSNPSDTDNPAVHHFPEGEFVPSGFFEKVDIKPLKDTPSPSVDWRYEKRRQVHQILPFLYLGPWSCLADRGWLNQEGVTLLLGIRHSQLAKAGLLSGAKTAAELNIMTASIDYQNNQDLISKLPDVIRGINEHIASSVPLGLSRSTGKKVLVFCETGNSSALVVMAYLMVMLNISPMKALDLVQSQRLSVIVDGPASQLLLAFEAIIVAKRDVERVRRASMLDTSASLKKRTNSRDTDDMDIDEIEFWDLERKPLAPFQDRSTD